MQTTRPTAPWQRVIDASASRKSIYRLRLYHSAAELVTTIERKKKSPQLQLSQNHPSLFSDADYVAGHPCVKSICDETI